MEKKLNIRNTLAKFVLDQTVAALINVVTFLGGVKLLDGGSMDVCWQVVKQVCQSIHLRPHKSTFSAQIRQSKENSDVCKFTD